MHSSFRKELYGTSKVLRSIRTRPVYRSPTNPRRFSSRNLLLSQPGPKNNGANHAGSNLPISDHPKDSQSKPNASPPNIDADSLEKCLQFMSDNGQSLHVCDALSEKDENGKRTLLPHIRKELEESGQHAGQDGTTSPVIGLELRNGSIRRLTPADLEQDRSSRPNITEPIDKFIVRSDGNGGVTATHKTIQPNVTAEKENQNEHEQKQGQEQGSSPVDKDGGVNPNSDFLQNMPPKFHGSSAARRQRERQTRPRDRNQVVVLPEWFHERNVILQGEGPLNLSQPAQVQSIWRFDELSREPVLDVLPPSSANPEAPQILKESESPDSGDTTALEKEQTYAASPGGDEPMSHGAQPRGSSASAESNSSTLIALPNSRKRYYIQGAQRKELILTARGRLRNPPTNLSNNRGPAIRSHILIHYTAQDGDIFLDHLVEDVARQLRTNLITLDAQDISALITKADVDPVMTGEARMLSYEIYGDIYNEDSPSEDEAAMFQEDAEDIDEGSDPPGRAGVPFIVGKPIAIDLKAIFNSRFNPRNSRKDSGKDRIVDFLNVGGISKPPSHILQPLVESVLSSPSNRQKSPDSESLQQPGDESSKDNAPSESPPHNLAYNPTIVHVKDLKAIQETNAGKAFLSQLYEQVSRRRLHGQEIMLIGTSCERESTTYNADTIRELQVSNYGEISSTVIITPAYPDTISETDSEDGLRNEIQRTVIPKQDRATRIQIINARHIYDMLQTKGVPLDPLKDGFWTKDLTEQLDEADRECLSRLFWTYPYIQRLAAILATSDFSSSSRPIAEAVAILEHSDKLKFSWAKQTQHGKSKRDRKGKDSDEPENEKLTQIRRKASQHEKKLLSGVVEPRKIRTTFQDIHIPAETVEALQTLTTLSLVRPDAFKYGVLASDRIPGLLLYGPPGTGKTLAAKAVARESGATMLEVSAADINDMYVGEGEKNVKALFSLAKKLSPCVVFLDEADAMFSARGNSNRRVSHRETLNQFLKEWDGMSNDSGSAFIMVATNRPMDLDDAVLRRLPRRLLVDLPTEKDRLEILKIHLRQESLADDVNLAKLASQTQFYSGSDLKNVAVAAALNCVREENALAKAHTGSEPYQYPPKRILTQIHFEKALEEITASISEDMSSLREIKKFDEQYGDKKGRKRRSPKWGFKSPAEADKVLDTVKVRS